MFPLSHRAARGFQRAQPEVSWRTPASSARDRVFFPNELYELDAMV
jgi:hypothetical protein